MDPPKYSDIKLSLTATHHSDLTSGTSRASSSFTSKLRHLFDRHVLKKKLESWAYLMPAKSHLSAEYNFPAGRWAGQGSG
ncbi:hypothetical protein P170DRAFT_167226 [Aspergillus steynii IBT 23096]|uniref:Uncharacterized protein n=1 Tax=Aspergillus steynii IBT 23096 TaxID=1392250 RepID=A0A2I2G747_9EURO|nr:uncharacterized protein P170DRAFT_167226 [Aspergillus steynii IBT 23096]PLB48706.1 hypothetical protein P170DRAFT_167226 [Aspergillus steynii IBT 23096]